MRARPLAIAVTMLALPAPAVAATANVQVGDYFFKPGYTRIEPGDTVLWRLAGADVHTVTTRKGATESFDSGELMPGQQYSRPFPAAGRYPYLCTIHPEMRGVVQVGPDTVDPKLAKPKATVGAKSVKVTFRLSEASKVSASVASAAKPKKKLRRVRAKGLQDGKRSVSVKTGGLSPGRYRVTVVARDPEGNSGVVRVPFKISVPRG